MKISKVNCDLKSCSFCTQCIPEWLPAIDVNRKTLIFKKGESLFREGLPVTGIFYLCSGRVKVHNQWGNKELIVRFAGSGEIVGHRGLGKQRNYPVSATAMENCTVCFIDLAFFEASLRINTGYLYKLLMFYTEELQESERRMRNLAHMPVTGRLATALLFLEYKFGITSEGVMNIELSRQDLAYFVGTTYETIFRTINDFIKDGLVHASGRQITILSKAGLEALALKADPLA